MGHNSSEKALPTPIINQRPQPKKIHMRSLMRDIGRASLPVVLMLVLSLAVAFWGSFLLGPWFWQVGLYGTAVLYIILLGVYSFYVGITPYPMPTRIEEAMLSEIPTDKDLVLYELGAGWGHLARAIAHARPRVQVHAVELSPIAFAYLWIRQKLRPLPNLIIYRRDFFTMDLSAADMVTCYLYPSIMQRLRPKFEQELKKGCIVVSSAFAIKDWTPARIESLVRKGFEDDKIYIYPR